MKQTALALSHLVRDPVPPGRAADHRLQPRRPPAHAGAARRRRAGVGAGHQPPARADARAAAPAAAPRRRAGRARRHRRRADRAHRRRRARRTSTGRRRRRRCARRSPRSTSCARSGARAQHLHARRRPGAGAVRRRRWPGGPGAGLHARHRRGSASTSSPTTSAPAAAAADPAIGDCRPGGSGGAGRAEPAMSGGREAAVESACLAGGDPAVSGGLHAEVRRTAQRPTSAADPLEQHPLDVARRHRTRCVLRTASTSQRKRSTQVLTSDASCVASRSPWNASPSYSQP